MKILNDGSMGFYESKWNYLFLLIIPAFILFLFFTKGAFQTGEDFYVTAFVLVICALFVLICFYKIFIDKSPYVKLRHDCVEIRGMAPLLWEDIYAMRVDRRRVGKRGHNRYHEYMCFEVRDLYFYKLTLGQKVRKTFGGTPFEFNLNALSKKDRELFEKEIRARLKKDIEKLSQGAMK